jgi:hypothetical protein
LTHFAAGAGVYAKKVWGRGVRADKQEWLSRD